MFPSPFQRHAHKILGISGQEKLREYTILGPQTDAAILRSWHQSIHRQIKILHFQYTFLCYKHNAALNMSATTLGGKTLMLSKVQLPTRPLWHFRSQEGLLLAVSNNIASSHPWNQCAILQWIGSPWQYHCHMIWTRQISNKLPQHCVASLKIPSLL